MRVLFVMLHAGFVRNYDGALRQLASRGHEIHIAHELDRKKHGEHVLVERLAADLPTVTYGTAPAREPGLWTDLARIVRTYLDYLRYLDPRYADAVRLRERVERQVPPLFVLVARQSRRLGAAAVRTLAATFRVLEGLLPTSTGIDAFLGGCRPDIVLVTPLVDVGSEQVDFIKGARARRIPTALCVASWDNLTNKGLMRVAPDRVFVWNEAQKHEAVALHGVPPGRVVVTGAQIFDHWFTEQPSRRREEFCRLVGLRPDRPLILYLGSSFFIAPNEAQFVLQWIERIRSSGDPLVAGAGVLVRPHPNNALQWLRHDLTRFGNVGVWPPYGADPFSDGFRADYFDSLYHAGVAVGVNTSALIEAAIVGRTVCTILAPDFAHSQQGTLHFQHLVSGDSGLLRAATTWDEHVGHLRDALSRPQGSDEKSRRFVQAFVRPHGLDVPATPLLVEAVEALGAVPPVRLPAERYRRALRPALFPLALLLRVAWNVRNPKPLSAARKPLPWWDRLARALALAWAFLLVQRVRVRLALDVARFPVSLRERVTALPGARSPIERDAPAESARRRRVLARTGRRAVKEIARAVRIAADRGGRWRRKTARRIRRAPVWIGRAGRRLHRKTLRHALSWTGRRAAKEIARAVRIAADRGARWRRKTFRRMRHAAVWIGRFTTRALAIRRHRAKAR